MTIDPELIIDTYFSGVLLAIQAAMPILPALLTSSIIVRFFKWIFHSIYDFMCFDYPYRERKRAHKKIDNCIDAASSIIDIIDSKNKNNK